MEEQPIRITSKENPWIKRAVRLKEKKYRDREQSFWIEGERASGELLKHLASVRVFFVQEDHWAIWKERIPCAYWKKTYLIPEKLASHISATETFSGIGAIAWMPHWRNEEIFPKRGTLLYLDHVQDPGNIGTMIRTAHAFALDGILLSPECGDPFNPKVVRSAMGMLLNFPVLTQITDEDLKKASDQYGYQIIGATLKNGSIIHYCHHYTEPQIIVIGSEAFGISDKIDEICHNYVKIPISFNSESLNAAVACGIILSEINRQQNEKF